MIKTCFQGMIPHAGYLMEKECYFNDDASIVITFDNYLFCGEAGCVDVYYFDQTLNKYIQVWHQEPEIYNKLDVVDIIQLATNEYLIIFRKLNTEIFDIYKYDTIQNLFMFITNIVTEGPNPLYHYGVILDQNISGQLQIINLADDPFKVNIIVDNVKNYKLRENHGSIILETKDLNNLKQYYAIAPIFQELNIMKRQLRTQPKQINFYFKDSTNGQLGNIKQKYKRDGTLKVSNQSDQKGQSQNVIILSQNKIIYSKSSQKILRFFQGILQTKWVKYPQYIIGSIVGPDIQHWTYTETFVLDTLTARQIQILDRQQIYYNHNQNTVIIEYLFQQCQIRVHKLQIE